MSPAQISGINYSSKAHTMFLVYVNTLQFIKTRLRGIDDNDFVHIPQDEIERRFFVFPQYKRKDEISRLVEAGELEIMKMTNPKTGHEMTMYKATKENRVDLYLINPKPLQYDPTTEQMRDILRRVSLPDGMTGPQYFKAFLFYRDDLLDYFFTIDDFAGRVHTPVTNLHREQRDKILIDQVLTVSMDVCTMQPLIMAKVLKAEIGENDFSKWIEAGEDIYIKLKEAANLQDREQGKKRFFEILFSKPNCELVDVFGHSSWIKWVDGYKAKKIPENPHSRMKPHSNLAWLMQTTEVNIMRKVWDRLLAQNIPFLSVHDEIIVKQSDRVQAESIFRGILNNEFTYYRLNTKTIHDEQPPQVDDAPHVIGSDDRGLLWLDNELFQGYSIAEGVKGNSGRFFQYLPNGGVNVFSSLKALTEGTEEGKAMTFSQWMTIKDDELKLITFQEYKN